MANVEIEYTDSNDGHNLRTVQLPDDIFIRKIQIRNQEGAIIWGEEFHYDWLKEFMARNKRHEIQADSASS